MVIAQTRHRDATTNVEPLVKTQRRQRAAWRKRRLLRRYGPIVFWMTLISLASTDGLSAVNTSRIIHPLLLWLFPDMSEQGVASIHFLVRKGAHFTEYAILALLMARAFLSSSHQLLRNNWFGIVFVFVSLYALMDEYHQALVPTRSGSIYDCLIDMMGGATALLCLAWWRRQRRLSE